MGPGPEILRCVDDYRQLNRASWDERASVHAASSDYAFDRFVADEQHLSHVVRFALARLGEVAGLRGVHLQCHVGADTLSLARLGARMTGLDFSPVALAEGRRLAAATGTDLRFVESDVYDAVDALGHEQFDLVFTGIGALCWLPSVARWADVVSQLLRPGGRLFLREAHPVLWALDDARGDGALMLEHPYVETEDPLVWDDPTTYLQAEVELENSRTHEWNHGLGEIVTSLLDAGLQLTMLVEHDSLPWEALPGLMEQLGGGEWRLRDRPERLPHSYTLQAVKPGPVEHQASVKASTASSQ
jgi:SAM-dependent methyltransferase